MVDILIVEEVKFLTYRESANDDTIVSWKLDRCSARIKAFQQVVDI